MNGWFRLGAVGMGLVLSGCVATSVLGEGGGSNKNEAKAPAEGERPWLGVRMALPGAEPQGVQVKRVFRASPADEAGLAAGDVLRSVGGRSVNHPSEVSSELLKRQPGEVIEVVVERKESKLRVPIKLEAFPGIEEILRRERVGVEAPPLDGLEAVQGTAPLTLPELRGKVVVIDFWASWCVVCRKTVPILNRWYGKLGAQGVVFLGISNETFAAASRGIGSFGIEYPVAIDKSENVFPAYEASSLPTLYVLDRKGVVRAVEVGFSAENMQRLEKLLIELLDEKG